MPSCLRYDPAGFKCLSKYMITKPSASHPADCFRCDILCQSRTQVVAPTPCFPGGILVIGEAPGREEDERGEGFVGQAGRVVDRLLAEHGLKRGIDFGVANIVSCRPPENRKPKPQEVMSCISRLGAAILLMRPKVLLLVGGTATAAILGAGSLGARVTQSRQASFNDLQLAHEALRAALLPLLQTWGGIHCVPMPHTSGLAWNRKTPDGRRWSDVGREQVAMAVEIYRG